MLEPTRLVDPNVTADLSTDAPGSTGNPQLTTAHTASMGDVPVPAGYEVLGELGRGGMGVVYKAHHVALNRTVALKMILSGGHASAPDRQRFRQEAEAAAGLHHPNVVQVYEVGEHGGLPYFTLEFVDGGSLTKHAKDPLEARVAAALVEQIAHGVAHAHAQGIIHRDLKPDNVLLDNGVPKVTDFGLAKKLDTGDGLTASGAVMGTPSYMAPEQARGETKAVGPLADVYALGAILYRLLVGRPPFAAPTTMETLMLVMTDDPPPPSSLVPKLPRDVETICLKCLRKEPGQRYGSANELAEDLKRYLEGQPILARPVGPVERSWKWVKRNRVVSMATAAVFVALTAGSSVALWQAWEANTARKFAEGETGKAIKAKETAELEAETANSLTQFLNEVIIQADAGMSVTATSSANPNVTIREAILQAIPKVEGRFKDNPRVEIDVRHTIGKALYALGDYDGARTHLLRALHLSETEDGPDDSFGHKVAIHLARVDIYKKDFTSAKRWLDRGCEGLARTLGPAHRDTLFANRIMAWYHRERGEYRQAQELLDRDLEHVLRTFSHTHAEYYHNRVMHNSLLHIMGKYAEAVEKGKLLIDSCVQGYGRDSSLAILLAKTVGESLTALAKYVEAESLLLENIAASERSYGKNHNETLCLIADLAKIYNDWGKPDKAQAVLEPIIVITEAKYGARSSVTQVVLANYSTALMGRGRIADAIPILQRTIVASEAGYGSDHRETIVIVNNLAACYYMTQRYDDAEQMFSRAVAGFTKIHGPDHNYTVSTLGNHAAVLFNLGKRDAAKQQLAKILRAKERIHGPEHPETLLGRNNYALACQHTGDIDRAITLYASIAQSAAKIFESDNPIRRGYDNGHGNSLLYGHRYSEAEPILRRTWEIEAKLKPGDYYTYQKQTTYGHCLLRLKKYPEAETMLLAGIRGMTNPMTKTPASGIAATLVHRAALLVELYETTNRPAEAAKWRAESEKYPELAPLPRARK